MQIEVNADWWKTLFDEVYLITDARSVCDDTVTTREVDIITDLLPIQPQHRILDLCGGHGRHSLELCVRGYTACTLVDYSKVLTERARRQTRLRQNPVLVIRSDARETGLSSERFDHVLILGNSLGYIQHPEADGRILAESFRLLRSGGWLLVDVTDGDTIRRGFKTDSWHEAGDQMVICRNRELLEDTIHVREMVLSKQRGLVRDETYSVRLYNTGSLAALIETAGFRSLNIRTDFSPHEAGGDYGFMNCRMIATAQKP